MSSPSFDLSKVQFTSAANSFKNDGVIHKGTLTLSASIPGNSFLTSTQTFTLNNSPQFSMLYAFFQEFGDAEQQFIVGSGFNGPEWYLTSVDTRIGVIVTTSPHQGATDALIYPVINGNQVTVTAIINNPYSTTISYTSVNIPYAFFCYTLTN